MIKSTLKILILSMLLISLSLFLVYGGNTKDVNSNKVDNTKQTVQSAENKPIHQMNNFPKKNMKNLEKDQNFWNYLKSNHPSTFNLLQSIKDKHPKMYRKLLKISGRMYYNINKTSNPDIKNLLAQQIDNQTKLMEFIIKYKENKIKEEEFDKQAREILRNIHHNNIKIIELRLEEMKNKVESKVEEALQKIKKEIYEKPKPKMGKNIQR